MNALRYAAAVAAWLFVASVVYQVFLAGVGIFGAGSIGQHRDFGYTVPLLALIVLALVAVARMRGAIVPGILLFVAAVVQTILPIFRADAPLVAALHPVNALVVGYLALVVARRATAVARAPRETVEARAASQAA